MANAFFTSRKYVNQAVKSRPIRLELAALKRLLDKRDGVPVGIDGNCFTMITELVPHPSMSTPAAIIRLTKSTGPGFIIDTKDSPDKVTCFVRKGNEADMELLSDFLDSSVEDLEIIEIDSEYVPPWSDRFGSETETDDEILERLDDPENELME